MKAELEELQQSIKVVKDRLRRLQEEKAICEAIVLLKVEEIHNYEDLLERMQSLEGNMIAAIDYLTCDRTDLTT